MMKKLLLLFLLFSTTTVAAEFLSRGEITEIITDSKIEILNGSQDEFGRDNKAKWIFHSSGQWELIGRNERAESTWFVHKKKNRLCWINPTKTTQRNSYPHGGKRFCFKVEKDGDDLKLYRIGKVRRILENVEKISSSTQLPVKSTMTEDEIVKTFSGKTVTGYHRKKGFSFTRYYDPNGTLISKSNRKGTRTGKWSAERGKLCEEFGKKGCHKVARDGGAIKKYNKNGKNIVTYKKFLDGRIL